MREPESGQPVALLYAFIYGKLALAVQPVRGRRGGGVRWARAGARGTGGAGGRPASQQPPAPALAYPVPERSVERARRGRCPADRADRAVCSVAAAWRGARGAGGSGTGSRVRIKISQSLVHNHKTRRNSQVTHSVSTDYALPDLPTR